MPAIVLGSWGAAKITRLTRAGMGDVLREDYIRTARGKGLQERTVLWRHALQNSLLPVLSALGLTVGAMLGGAIITETVFAWPGVGKWLFDGVVKRDYMVIQGGTLLVATTFVLVNLLVDVLYAIINPRISVR
jgi:dipeptide transport system permease protein